MNSTLRNPKPPKDHVVTSTSLSNDNENNSKIVKVVIVIVIVAILVVIVVKTGKINLKSTARLATFLETGVQLVLCDVSSVTCYKTGARRVPLK